MTTSVLPVGKYRSRKEWSTSSIPELVSLEDQMLERNAQQEKGGDGEKQQPPPQQSPLPFVDIQVNGVSQLKTPRRSSLAIGLLGGGGGSGSHSGIGGSNALNPMHSDKYYKRRSSIAVAFLGRRDHTKVIGSDSRPADRESPELDM